MSKYWIDKKEPRFDLSGQSRVRMFKLKTTKPPRNWYIRVRLLSGQYCQKSLKTPNERDALRLGQIEYSRILALEEQGLSPATSNTFQNLAKEFFAKKRLSKNRYRIFHGCYRLYLSWFDNYSLISITDTLYIEYVKWRMKQGFERTGNLPRATTIKKDRDNLLQILRFGVEKRRLLRTPKLSNITELQFDYQIPMDRSKYRGGQIDDTRLKRILYLLGKWRYERPDKKTIFARHRLFYYIMITSAAVMRPGKGSLNLKWKDFKSEQDRHGTIIYYFWVRKGKKQARGGQPRMAVLSNTAIGYVNTWRAISRDKGFGDDDDYIFPATQNDGPISSSNMAQLFRITLIRLNEFQKTIAAYENDWVDLTVDDHGRRITPYSFRSTKITNLMAVHDNVAMVAQMAGTSVETMFKSYVTDRSIKDIGTLLATHSTTNTIATGALTLDEQNLLVSLLSKLTKSRP